MYFSVDYFPGEARIKKPTAKTPPKQGEAQQCFSPEVDDDCTVGRVMISFFFFFTFLIL